MGLGRGTVLAKPTEESSVGEPHRCIMAGVRIASEPLSNASLVPGVSRQRTPRPLLVSCTFRVVGVWGNAHSVFLFQ